MKNNKIMILGAGNEQLPIIKLAIENHLDIVLVSPKGNYPGLSLVKNIYYEDVKDVKQILKIAKSENIGGIISDQIDVAIPSIGMVNEKLGFRGINYECALKFTNKYKMKEEAVKCGIDVVPFEKADNIDCALDICVKINYPVIIKPIDSSASRGIFIIYSPEELIKYFPITQAASLQKQVLIEKYIKGEEFVVDGFVDDYKNNTDKHNIQNIETLPYKKTFAWIVSNAKRYETARKYKHPNGAIIWVNL